MADYVDDPVNGLRHYRHPQKARAFEAVLNAGGRTKDLKVGTDEGISIELRAHHQGEMQPVLRVEGVGSQVTVTNTITGETMIVHMTALSH
jgi:hypothetical protein